MFIALSYCSKPFVNSTLAETRDESEIHQYTAKEQGILLQACLLWRIFYDVVCRRNILSGFIYDKKIFRGARQKASGNCKKVVI